MSPPRQTGAWRLQKQLSHAVRPGSALLAACRGQYHLVATPVAWRMHLCRVDLLCLIMPGSAWLRAAEDLGLCFPVMTSWAACERTEVGLTQGCPTAHPMSSVCLT